MIVIYCISVSLKQILLNDSLLNWIIITLCINTVYDMFVALFHKLLVLEHTLAQEHNIWDHFHVALPAFSKMKTSLYKCSLRKDGKEITDKTIKSSDWLQTRAKWMWVILKGCWLYRRPKYQHLEVVKYLSYYVANLHVSKQVINDDYRFLKLKCYNHYSFPLLRSYFWSVMVMMTQTLLLPSIISKCQKIQPAIHNCSTVATAAIKPSTSKHKIAYWCPIQSHIFFQML